MVYLEFITSRNFFLSERYETGPKLVGRLLKCQQNNVKYFMKSFENLFKISKSRPWFKFFCFKHFGGSLQATNNQTFKTLHLRSFITSDF